ncbi:hypothetical protein B0O41_0404 [Propionibacteriaceae bacterium ES.041]|uniref:hypothetical protein n=1 Tax=Enemella evansiae TaxID=2016499 RepID=UPI000B9759B9|nr:hypothetical protein [Enemella evansiae]OYN96385.1 hypothetical protein CGZ96_14145 [Enemella evansiae]PFG65635.1 hypothetical protein B0O41_0404 [Propionibacteriaceae bacterium ES.041]
MAEVRKHGKGGGGQIAAAIERAMAQGVRPSGAGAPPEPGQQSEPPRNTQNLVTATSFLGNDPFLVTAPKPVQPVEPEGETAEAAPDEDPDDHPDAAEGESED